MTLYASVELMLIGQFPLSIGVDAYDDIHVIGIPEYPDGVYRHVSREFLRWMAARIKIAAAPESGVPAEALKLRQEFYQRCLGESGLTPSEKPLRSDYGRPTEDSAFTFRGSFCVWENTEVDVAEFMAAMESRKSKSSESAESDESPEFHESSEADEITPELPKLTDLPISPVSDLPDFTPRPPPFVLCRGPGLKTRYFRGDSIEFGYSEWYGGSGCNIWHSIRPEWLLPAGVAGSDRGFWHSPHGESAGGAVLAVSEAISDLLADDEPLF